MKPGESASRFAARGFLGAAARYGLGRGANALLSITLFVWLARELGVSGYGPYVALIATLELLLVLGNLGTEWLSSVEVPRLAQAGAGRALRRFVLVCLAVQGAAFGLLALILLLAAPWLAAWLGLQGAQPALQVYAALLLVEGLARSLRDQLLSSLLLQGAAQLAQLLRNALVLLGLWWMGAGEAGLSLLSLAWLELGASLLGLALGAGLLARPLLAMPAGPALRFDAAALGRRALHAWLSTLSQQAWSGHVLVLLATRLLGSETGALLGFARNLAEQVRRFMPLEFGFNLVRTYLVTRCESLGPAALPSLVALLWKLNTLLVLPLVVLALVQGEALARWVGGEQYAGAGPMLAAWLCWVLAWSHHRLSETLAVLLEASGSMGRYSLALLPALALLVLALDHSGWAAAFAVLILVELGYSLALATAALRRASLRYPLAQLQLPSLALAGGLCALLFALPSLVAGLDWRWGVLPGVLGFALLLLLLRPLSAPELRMLRAGAVGMGREA